MPRRPRTGDSERVEVPVRILDRNVFPIGENMAAQPVSWHPVAQHDQDDVHGEKGDQCREGRHYVSTNVIASIKGEDAGVEVDQAATAVVLAVTSVNYRRKTGVEPAPHLERRQGC
jgi:hypothetical protein